MKQIIESFISGAAVRVTPENITDFLALIQDNTEITWFKNTKPLDFNPLNHIKREFCFIDCKLNGKYMLWIAPENFNDNFIDFDEYLNGLQRLTFDKSIIAFLKKKMPTRNCFE